MNDGHIMYAIRVPREAALSDADLLRVAHLADEDQFGADLAAWMAARIQQI